MTGTLQTDVVSTMLGLGDLNLRERLAPDVPTWVTEWVCAGVCAALSGLLRALISLVVVAPPYVFLYPLVLLATLLAGGALGWLLKGRRAR